MTNEKKTHLINRLLNNIKIDEETGCWIWQRYCNSRNGYGHFWIGRTKEGKPDWKYSHRLSYELFVGPIPEGKELAHICHTRSCCNPKHLIATTHYENVQMSKVAGRTLKGVGKPNAKLNDSVVRTIRDGTIFTHLTVAEVAAIFNVTRTTIHAVLTGKTWTHITPEQQ